MDDLLLFQLLLRGDADDDRVLPLLRELGRLSFLRRAAFFGVLGAALQAKDAAVREAALAALRGAEGPLAVRAVVAALSDDASSVRLAAVQSLAALAEHDPWRAAHAVFHPDPEVRTAMVHRGAPRLLLYLAADEASRPLLFPEDGTKAPTIRAHAGSWTTILELERRGLLARAVARRLLVELDLDGFERWLDRSARRPRAVLMAWRAGTRRPWGPRRDVDPEGTRSDLEELLALFWDESEASRSFFAQLSRAFGGHLGGHRMEAEAALLSLTLKHGTLPAPALGTLAIVRPESLAWPWLDRAARRAAVRLLYERQDHPRLDDEMMEALLWTDLALHPRGGVDLFVVGALLRLARTHAYDLVDRFLGQELVLDALLTRPEESAPFLTLAEDARGGRAVLLRAAWERSPEIAAQLTYAVAAALPSDKLDFLEALHAGEAMLVVRRALRSSLPLPPGRADAIGAALGNKLFPHEIGPFVLALTEDDATRSHPVGGSVLAALALARTAEELTAALCALSTEVLLRFVGALPLATAFPFGKELALAHALRDHPNDALRAWAASRLPRAASSGTPTSSGLRALSPPEVQAIADASEATLPLVLSGLRGATVSGLPAALAVRSAPAVPSVEACTALIGSHAPLDEIDREIERHAGATPAFDAALMEDVVVAWDRAPAPGPLARVWLFRWERHAALLDAWLGTLAPRFSAAVAELLRGRGPVVTRHALAAVADRLLVASYRDKARLATMVDEPLVRLLVSLLPSSGGERAAAGLVAILRAGVAGPLLASVRADALLLLPDCAAETRERLAPLVDGRDLPRAVAPRDAVPPLDEEIVRRIRALHDLDELARLVGDERLAVVHEATLRLLELGEPGQTRLADLLDAAGSAAAVRPVTDSVPLWTDGPSVDRVRALAKDGARPVELRYRLAFAFAERREPWALDAAKALLDVPANEPWFRPADWDALVRSSPDALVLASDVAASPQPHAYLPATELLLGADDREPVRVLGLRRFLSAGADRMGSLRRRAAAFLHARGDLSGFVLVLEASFDDAPKGGSTLLPGVPASLVRATTDAYLLAGRKAAKETSLFEHLDQPGVLPTAREAALEVLLHECTTDKVRQKVAQRLRSAAMRTEKLRRVAEVFAWGIRIGRELTGALFRVQMVSGRGLGHTRLRERRIFVTPLPILRRDRHGQEIVEGLILHELGHHLFHKGDEAESVWNDAQKRGIHGLLNLVADEHLERNLRAMDPAFGDRLKKLAAYAFQHMSREIQVARLLDVLQARSFEVLSKAELGVARDPECVRIDHGEALLAMDRSDLSFARFVRALRMGLGNRRGDPKVEAGLALFRGGFRHGDMKSLLVIAEKLQEIFGWETQLVEEIGAHEGIEGDLADESIHGEGLSDDEVQGEVERVLDPRRKRGEDGKETGPPGRPWINVNPDEAFSLITRIERLPFDPAEHARYVRDVARHVGPLRGFFERLGLRMEPARMRVSGRAFDKTRTEALVLRSDPRVLIARAKAFHNDLFLGVLVDCSGSMQSGNLLERAKRFAVLLAEAARGLPGVDVRLFGFTDSVIWDAGDASRCAAHALASSGGNNDAAGLYHLATVAKRSRRRAKVLVMVSDGLPTECTVAALRGLVQRLGKREGMCCAQVAVRPLTEQCFPHHVLLDGDDESQSVRRFGETVAKLVHRTLST